VSLCLLRLAEKLINVAPRSRYERIDGCSKVRWIASYFPANGYFPLLDRHRVMLILFFGHWFLELPRLQNFIAVNPRTVLGGNRQLEYENPTPVCREDVRRYIFLPEDGESPRLSAFFLQKTPSSCNQYRPLSKLSDPALIEVP
jgi:hypothetical protein